MPHAFRFGWALCLLGLGLLASCEAADDSGQAQSFAAHINGSYTAAAVSTSTR